MKTEQSSMRESQTDRQQPIQSIAVQWLCGGAEDGQTPINHKTAVCVMHVCTL